MPVWQRAAHERAQDGFLGEGMHKHQAAQPGQHYLPFGTGAGVDQGQQIVEFDMVRRGQASTL